MVQGAAARLSAACRYGRRLHLDVICDWITSVIDSALRSYMNDKIGRAHV